MHLKPFKKSNSKKGETTRDLINNKNSDKIINNMSRNSPQNSSDTVRIETENIKLDREIPK